jgi:3-oxoacyl-[acyl-carrier protein] reductase
MPRTLENKVALVTGSSRGIGAAIAKLFAQEGAKVALHGRDQSALSAVRADVARSGGTVLEAVAELTSFEAIEAMRAQIERTARARRRMREPAHRGSTPR